jgi:methylated-DNA-[protein]-cysteine S-methyltransferase
MNETEIYSLFDSPIGELLLGAGEPGAPLRRLWFRGPGVRNPAAPINPAWRRDDDAFGEVRAQLDEYFAGTRHEFDLDLDLVGSDWERRVWAALREIPYGETRSYGELATRLDHSIRAARAVGLANGRNPIAVIVPCHRVIGADGSLTGFGGGLERKRALLDLESGRLALSLG